ncbi:hypothetical protein B5S27_g5790 [[Candida] boidinii]|nr:hypothetical protein B5S27_g5790 [[Candida] boidinii]
MAQHLITETSTNDVSQESPLHHITLLDIAKAFDTIKTSYIHQVLQRMNFPKEFINYILDHIDNNFGQLLNGHKIYNKPIPIQNGVRQGLPISPILFNLCLEPLIAKLADSLVGMSIPSIATQLNTPPSPIKILAFADDLITFNYNFNDTVNTLEIFDEFGSISGCKLNQEKTKIYCNSHNINRIENSLQNHQITTSPQSIDTNPTYLGVPLLKWDWHPKLTELKARFQKILFQDLTMTQRVLGIKTYIYSTLYFLDQHNPIPYIQLLQFEKDIENMTLQYLPIKSKQIKQLLYIPLSQGGFGLPQLTIQVKGRRASYIYDLITNYQNDHPLYSILYLHAQNLMNELVEQELTFPIVEQEIQLFFKENQYEITDMNNTGIYDIPGKLTNQLMITTTPYHTMFYPNTQLKYLHPISNAIDRYQQNDPHTKTFTFNLSYYDRKIKTQQTRDLLIQEFTNKTRPYRPGLLPSEFITPELPQDIEYKYVCQHEPSLYFQFIEYLKAWHSLVGTKNAVRPEFKTYTLEEYNQTVQLIPPEFLKEFHEAPHISYGEEKPITNETFRKNSAKHHGTINYIPITTKYWAQHISKTETSWSHYFRWLTKYRIYYPFHTEWFYFLQVGLLNSKAFGHCHMCSLDCHGPGGIRHCIFECPISHKVWQKMTNMPPSKLNISYLIGNSQLTIQQINKINYYLGCIIHINVKRFALIEYNEDASVIISPMTNITINTYIQLYKTYYKIWVDIIE